MILESFSKVSLKSTKYLSEDLKGRAIDMPQATLGVIGFDRNIGCRCLTICHLQHLFQKIGSRSTRARPRFGREKKITSLVDNVLIRTSHLRNRPLPFNHRLNLFNAEASCTRVLFSVQSQYTRVL